MNDPSSKDLLGFMLGALEPDEYLQIEKQIELDHELKEELQNIRHQASSLDLLDPPGIAPVGLARRTCEFIALQPAIRIDPVESEPDNPGTAKTNRRWFAEDSAGAGRHRRNSIMDLVIVLAVMMLLAAIALPLLNHSRFNSRMLACEKNLQEVGLGLLKHADLSGGKYLQMPESGNLSFAGVYAPTLLQSGLVPDAGSFLCPEVGNVTGRQIPTIEQILAADGASLREFQKKAGGDYANNMGQSINGHYDSGENRHRSTFIVLADNPGVTQPGRASNNHGGYGQNVFFEDGHTQFLKSPELNGDAIYENDWGLVGLGAHIDDIVLVPSATKLNNFQVD